MTTLTPQEALAKALHDSGHLNDDSCPVPELHRRDAIALLAALTSVGYALVPVKEALTFAEIERLRAALDLALDYAKALLTEPFHSANRRRLSRDLETACAALEAPACPHDYILGDTGGGQFEYWCCAKCGQPQPETK